MEYKTIKKRFFSSCKECDWLNKLGEQGYLLIGRTENTYTFELTQKTLFYSVEWLDCAPECEEAVNYFNAYKENGVELTATYSLWAYFVTSNPITPSDDARRRTAVGYRNTALWLCAADLITAVLVAYQFSSIPHLEANSVFFKAPTLESASNSFLQLLYRLWYGAEKLLYFYTKLCANLFGKTKASLALGILIPLAIVLSVLCALWIGEWIKNMPPKPQPIKEDTQDVCQEPETSGKTENNC